MELTNSLHHNDEIHSRSFLYTVYDNWRTKCFVVIGHVMDSYINQMFLVLVLIYIPFGCPMECFVFISKVEQEFIVIHCS